MDFNAKKIGIWGYGIMGKSALDFFLKKNKPVSIFDQKQLSIQEKATLNAKGVPLFENTELESFLISHDMIIPSSGIDLRQHKQFYHKIVTELDFFSAHFNKPIIAITGTLGKTTITNYLSSLLRQAGFSVLTGGNIGVGLFDLLENQNNVDYAVIEVSSFQLEHCKLFAPDLAIWTNFYPNHLDRHNTIDDYFNAKTKISCYQKSSQKALLPLKLAQYYTEPTQEVIFFSLEKPDTIHKNVFFYHENAFFYGSNNAIEKLYDFNQTMGSYKENWLIILSALKMLNIPTGNLELSTTKLGSFEHRLEKIVVQNSIVFYNDSKSTVPEATLAAVQALDKHSIFLFLGGLSKGIDREAMIKALKSSTVKKIFCFGKQAEELHGYCKKYQIDAESFHTLDDAFLQCMQQIKNDITVLFSPSGASFDLFSNYEERGRYFKQLIKKYFHEK